MLLSEELKKLLIKRLSSFYPNISLDKVRFSEIAVNDYSFCFEINFNQDNIYIKIPKRNQAYKNLEDRTIFPITHRDISFAKEEYISLVQLAAGLQSLEGMSVIEPIVYIEEINAIASKKFNGSDFFEEIRKIPFLSNTKRKRINERIVILAKSISKISAQGKLPMKFYDGKKTLTKVSKYLKEIKEWDFLRNEEAFYSQDLEARLRTKTKITLGYKGVDIRNVLIDGQGSMCLLDPGKSKEESQEAFFARIYATLIILYWGSPFFIFRFKSLNAVCHLFKETIQEETGFDNIIFNLESRKELTKHWCLARRALSSKRFPDFLKKFLEKYYIDRFYIDILRENKSNLTSG